MSAAAPALADQPVGGRQRLGLDLTGHVQGVGFRPFVHRLATAEGLVGFVCNTETGAALEVEGAPEAIARFLRRLDDELRLPARVETRTARDLPVGGGDAFSIAESRADGAGRAMVLPDLVTCPECLAELFDPTDRRYLYPFTTCMHCGPRYSIIEATPYDRSRTTMRRFSMCPVCRAEYESPGDRRFHSETNCCAACGPRLSLLDATGAPLATGDAAFAGALSAILDGLVVAVQGVGGFQLVADAGNEATIDGLRRRKRRPAKPFAIMVADLRAALGLAAIDEAAATALASPAGPIVLVPRRAGIAIAPAVAPGSPLLGLMLPTTPLHHMLVRGVGAPVVATSGNRSGEPIVTAPGEAVARLEGIADLFLVHDRPIARPVDDSVVRVIAGTTTVLRNARGLAPTALSAASAPPALALGGHQKVAVALHLGDRIVLGPHIGDLDTVAARDALELGTAGLRQLYRLEPSTVAVDAHPDGATTQLAARLGLAAIRVPHHLAHVLAGMVDNSLAGPVLGIAWDGTGYGSDGTSWGGEAIAIADGRWRRAGHLLPFRLPGGDAAARQPWRAALGVLHAIGGEAAVRNGASRVPGTAADTKAASTFAVMLGRGVNAPLTSSAGRLFDAAAALLGLAPDRLSFEGEAAMALEYAASEADSPYELAPVAVHASGDNRLVLDWRPTLAELARLGASAAPTGRLALGFHSALADAVVAAALHTGIRDVLLTGGCFQNAVLAETARDRLAAAGFAVHLHRRVPPNDGGLAVGQAAFAASPLIEETA